ncbi:KpsF/GutQ family sugar-phosphate isomerase [Hufsiella ginkgonis]|uniref:KpsF/GutQ family sugar-phosphate isomerase n=1 Tax=Hufsiella ginkgonis TaxID=2695274 RepID=A0A7K1XWF7_9SPHI|nr:KpsF/GutQ family sugar-phosphate isomerase [Hufsiella ginkgonis]MXV15109.1 KpsF/GutQ family sugar-phosphate isomerase [Hufsiella ginkgonis]
MKSSFEILAIAHNTLRIEADGISGLIPLLKNDFAVIVETILDLKGRVIITGVGKSAIIAQKIVATLNSTGTPSVYMHAGDAIHGDLGIIQRDDLVICISNSGNTPEIKVLIPFLRQSGNTLVAMVGDLESTLAKQADFIMNTTIQSEACPNNLAPTTSTTAQLALGDALAVCLLECREFSSADFARFHPGGSLGKRLYLKVADLAVNNEKPKVLPTASIRSVLVEITRNRLGAVAVLEEDKVTGIITDGDIRRMLEKYDSLEGITAHDVMGKNPRTIAKDELAVNALELMRANNITQLPVTDSGRYFGIVHLHDLLKEGII